MVFKRLHAAPTRGWGGERASTPRAAVVNAEEGHAALNPAGDALRRVVQMPFHVFWQHHRRKKDACVTLTPTACPIVHGHRQSDEMIDRLAQPR